MAKFCDLPLEIILDIIEWSLESSGDRRHRFLQLNNLSLVCRYLHAATVPNIFRKYRLQLREERDADRPRPGPMCFLTGTSLLKWNEDAFHARLDHLRKKAAFVRELQIVDFGQPVDRNIFIKWVDPEEENGPAPFDSTLVPALLETLDTLSGVVSVVFEGTEDYPPFTNFPVGLWQWLSRLRPPRLSFKGHFVFSDSLEPLPSVRSLSLLASAEANRVIEVVRPTQLNLTVGIEVETEVLQRSSFKELFELYPSLEVLELRIFYPIWLPFDYFDFTSHPQTRIIIHITVPDIGSFIEAPGAWDETEGNLTDAFVDDFTKFDVHRDEGSDTIVISRPLPGQAGGIRGLNIPERESGGFEQAMLAYLGQLNEAD